MTAVIVGAGAAPPAVAGTAGNVFAAVVAPPQAPPYPPAYLACVDAATLQPVGARVTIKEYHSAWALSPDGSSLAVGLSDTGKVARTGIRIFDARSFAHVRDVETGAYADAIAWISPRRLLARAADSGMLIDPQEGRILRRAPLRHVRATDVVAAARRLVMLGTDARRLVVVAPGGARRVAALPRGLGSDPRLLVDARRARAYVFGARRYATVDLVTLRVRSRALRRGRVSGDASRASPGRAGPTSATADQGHTAWLREGSVAAVAAPGRRRRGVRLVDVARGRVEILDRAATAVTASAGTLLTYGPRGLWLRGGRRARRVIDDTELAPGDVQVAGTRAYATAGGRLNVVDLVARRVLRRGSPAPVLLAALPLPCG